MENQHKEIAGISLIFFVICCVYGVIWMSKIEESIGLNINDHSTLLGYTFGDIDKILFMEDKPNFTLSTTDKQTAETTSVYMRTIIYDSKRFDSVVEKAFLLIYAKHEAQDAIQEYERPVVMLFITKQDEQVYAIFIHDSVDYSKYSAEPYISQQLDALKERGAVSMSINLVKAKYHEILRD